MKAACPTKKAGKKTEKSKPKPTPKGKPKRPTI
jgi:hypothetical protein